MAKTILEQFQFNVKVIRICSKICGADIIDPKYRVYYLTWIVVAMICFFFSMTFYTVYVTIIANGEWSVYLQIMCMVGSGFQGASKLFSAIANKHNLQYLLNDLDLIYQTYEKKREGYKNILQKSVVLFTKVNKGIAGTYCSVCSVLILSSLYSRIFHNRREFVMQFLVPGIDPNTDTGFIMLNVLQSSCLILGVFGNFAGDMYFITYTTHVQLLKEILRCKFEDLNVIVRTQPNKEDKSMELLKDVFKWHQKYIRFIELVKCSFFWIILIQIVTIAGSIGCTLFCLLLGTWPIGFAYLVYCFVMLYTYCGLGTLVEIANDGFIYSCYNDSLWYEYSIREQKMLHIMLRMSQNTTGLTVGAVYPLSVNTGLQLTKTIYTFTMMLINFLN